MKHTIRSEIISVGTELLLGQIVNSNAAWMSEKLANKGISVFYHTAVGDNLSRLENIFEQASKRSDIIFVTGGLGPTEDDLTREAFRSFSGLEITEDTGTIAKIQQLFERMNKTMTPNNRKQAVVFEGSTVYQNSVGIAPGILVEHQGCYWVFMPGVPNEMKAIMQESILPFFEDKYQLNQVIESRMLRFIGIGESQLEHEIKDLIAKQTNPTIAPLATEGEVALRITAMADSKELANKWIDETEKKISRKVGSFIYGYDEESIEDRVFQLLQKAKLTISSAESLTGGAFSSRVVERNGSSDILQGSAVVYQPSMKVKVLGISKKILDQYGTVSEECAEAMSNGVKTLYHSDIGISFTGVAGPSKTEGKEVGTVYISICDGKNQVITKKFHFHGDRLAIRNRTVKKGFELLYQLLRKDK
ncbi:competence/damage-inducible protein A [Gracilibacillus sp. YIM 98692]|uniref:competence/damage-inducible protein A n=1 Tax=Gracilibacillus sp. YIM 98692 TaxID=2663532 RepID=UPI0013D2FB40|nr:competence/damage-inducible protein A [Gracilibacillus sp. YIM 98692]